MSDDSDDILSYFDRTRPRCFEQLSDGSYRRIPLRDGWQLVGSFETEAEMRAALAFLTMPIKGSA